MTKTKNVWTPEHEAKLLSLEDLRKATTDAIVYLKVAQRCEVSPEHLQVLIRREYKRKCAIMLNVHKWVNSLCGQFAYGKEHEDGERYSWYVEFPMVDKYYVTIEFGRYHGVDAFDLRLGMEMALYRRRNKKSAQRVAVLFDEDGIDGLRDVKRFYADALKQIKDQYNIVPAK